MRRHARHRSRDHIEARKLRRRRTQYAVSAPASSRPPKRDAPVRILREMLHRKHQRTPDRIRPGDEFDIIGNAISIAIREQLIRVAYVQFVRVIQAVPVRIAQPCVRARRKLGRVIQAIAIGVFRFGDFDILDLQCRTVRAAAYQRENEVVGQRCVTPDENRSVMEAASRERRIEAEVKLWARPETDAEHVSIRRAAESEFEFQLCRARRERDVFENSRIAIFNDRVHAACFREAAKCGKPAKSRRRHHTRRVEWWRRQRGTAF